jgi:hypothetical protein
VLFQKLFIKKFSRDEKAHFLINIAIGIAIIAILQLYENTDFGEDSINRAFDYIIAKEAAASAGLGNISAANPKNAAMQISFIDLGRSFKENEPPLLTPRDELAKVIEAAFKGKAKVIVLDILLEKNDCCNPGHDQELRRVFQDIIGQGSPMKIVFPMRIGRDGMVKKNLFADLIEKHPNFYPAFPAISATASDRIVRYWIPYETTAGNDKYPLLWNAAFLGAMLAHGKEDELKTISQRIAAQNSPKSYSIKIGNSKEIVISYNRDDVYRNRIRFFLIPENTLSAYPGGNLFELVNGMNELDYVNFKDKVVIIGNTHPDAGDTHLTPAGEMAGMYIVGNAMNTIAMGLQPAHSSIILNIVIELLVIILAAYVMSGFPILIVYILKTIVLASALSAASYWFFLKTGVLLNFTFAIVGMGFYDLALSFEKDLLKRIRKGKEQRT